MRKTVQIVLIISAVLLGGCKDRKNGIALVGINESDSSAVVFVSAEEYSKTFSSLLQNMHDSTMPALKDIPTASNWNLRTVLVGVGMTFEGSVGPIAKASVSPKLKMVFSNSVKPSIP